jgi:hypothetical protein
MENKVPRENGFILGDDLHIPISDTETICFEGFVKIADKKYKDHWIHDDNEDAAEIIEHLRSEQR